MFPDAAAASPPGHPGIRGPAQGGPVTAVTPLTCSKAVMRASPYHSILPTYFKSYNFYFEAAALQTMNNNPPKMQILPKKKRQILNNRKFKPTKQEEAPKPGRTYSGYRLV